MGVALMVKVWNPVAIDYKEGVIIFDPVTGCVYTEDRARQQPQEVRVRLINKPRKLGCFVMTIEEARIANQRRMENE